MRTTLLSLLLLSARVVCAADSVTFAEHIAPLVYKNCVTCHRPGEAAPFSLITYDDVRKRGTLIATVTKARYMPPWHAEHAYGEFADERRLTDTEIATLGDWVKQGMPEGDGAKMPSLPQFTDGWHLGKPDLIVEMPAGFEVPSSGPDVFRNFAIALNLAEDKWIRAIEFRPSARKAAHHALFAAVAAGSTKRFEGIDGKPGFGGMGTVGVNPGQGSIGLGGWAVGGTPTFLPEGLAVKLPKANDFLLQMHFHPTGKVETEKSLVGFYFAKQAPEKNMIAVGLPTLFGFGNGIDIAPGDKNWTLQDSMTLPVDVKVYGALAHAHYLGKDIKATATLPDGSTRPLLWIQDWDFNWQETYTYKDAFVLPKGTRIDTKISYDNSADNPRNPSNPPKRVLWGEESFDEMGTVALNVVTLKPEDEPVLLAALNSRAQAEIRRGAADGTAKRYLDGQARRGAPAIQPNQPRLANITVLDREGKTIATVGEPGSYNQAVALSPDGARVAAIRTDQATRVADVWVYEIASGKGIQITSDPESNSSVVWSPDGLQLVYSTNIENTSNLFRKASDGSGVAELIYKHKPGEQLIITDWSASGRLALWAGNSAYSLDLNGDRKPVALFDEHFNDRGARFSLDEGWLAYSSTRSGRFQLYAAPLNAGRLTAPGTALVEGTAVGGILWRRDGKEIVYLSTEGPQTLMAVDVNVTDSGITAGKPHTLFVAPAPILATAQISSIGTRDLDRFVLVIPVDAR